MKRYIRLIILLLILSLQASAQTDTTQVEDLPMLSADYYNSESFLNKSFDYELLNKKRALIKKSNDLILLGAILCVGGGMATSFVGESKGWSTAVSIPVGVVVGAAFLLPVTSWSLHLRSKANRIQIETAYVLPMGKHTELGPALFSSQINWRDSAVGVGFETTF
jgi:hypothetical protein